MERSFEIRTAERQWLNGGPPLPLIRLLFEADQPVKAAVIARLVLSRPDCPDRQEIEAVLDRLDRAPAGWDEALQELARNPALEGWEALMRFNPGDLAYNRQRNALRKLRACGVDANLLFSFATQLGITPEAMELVETAPWVPRGRNPRREPHDMVAIRIAWSETELRERIKAAGGIWRPRHKLWEVDWETVRGLGLQARVVTEDLR